MGYHLIGLKQETIESKKKELDVLLTEYEKEYENVEIINPCDGCEHKDKFYLNMNCDKCSYKKFRMIDESK